MTTTVVVKKCTTHKFAGNWRGQDQHTGCRVYAMSLVWTQLLLFCKRKNQTKCERRRLWILFYECLYSDRVRGQVNKSTRPVPADVVVSDITNCLINIMNHGNNCYYHRWTRVIIILLHSRRIYCWLQKRMLNGIFRNYKVLCINSEILKIAKVELTTN